MIRRFKFEDEIHQNLSCVPMHARRKLDKAGVKISLEQWQALGRGERLAICHLPVDSDDEREALRIFIEEAVRNRGLGAAKPLSDEMRRAADPPAVPPQRLIENARAEGVALGQREWDRLDSDERYALLKLGGGAERSHNLAAALNEFLSR
jgi:hypothetical protein